MSIKNIINTRREFLKKTSLGGLGTALGMSASIPAFAEDSLDTTEHSVSAGNLHVKPRYHRWHVNEGAEWLEKNTGYNYLDWNIPVSQCESRDSQPGLQQTNGAILFFEMFGQYTVTSDELINGFSGKV